LLSTGFPGNCRGDLGREIESSRAGHRDSVSAGTSAVVHRALVPANVTQETQPTTFRCLNESAKKAGHYPASLNYVGWEERKLVAQDLKSVYHAAGIETLDSLFLDEGLYAVLELPRFA
jgi:hypothetical protein